MNVLFLTGHILNAPRKASITFLAEAMARQGQQVSILSVGHSWVSYLKTDKPWKTHPRNRWFGGILNMRGYVWFPVFHPFNMRHPLFNRLSRLIFRFFPLLLGRHIFTEAPDLIVVESGPGLMLMPRLHTWFPKARFVYSVSDRLKTLGVHPIIMDAEQQELSHFDLIQVPAQAMVADYPNLPVRYVPQGLDMQAFQQANPSPYTPTDRIHVISVGDMLFDPWVLETLATQRPHVVLHLFGKKATLGRAFPNVVEHGEVPFTEIVPYIQHARVGIAPYRPAPDADYLSQSSLKMIQYTYCKLPILAPTFAAAGRAHVCTYTPGNQTELLTAFDKSLTYDHGRIDISDIASWDERAKAIVEHALEEGETK